MTSIRKLHLALIAALCFLCFFFRLGSAGLFDFNEGLYTEIAREMYLRHDIVTPVSNGTIWYDKPPLAMWCDELSFAIFGISEFAARLPVAISATLLVLLTWWFGVKYFSDRTGLIAAAMLAFSPIYLGTARQMTMDIHQSWFVGLAMVCYILAYLHPEKRWKLLYYPMWIACGLGFMAKSVPGLLPIPLAFLFLLINERWNLREIANRVWESKPIPGVLLLLLIIAPWHYMMFREHGMQFYEQYYIHHHVDLLLGKDFSHVQPFWYYIPLLLVGFFPWGFFLPFALAKKSDPENHPRDYPIVRRFVFIWGIATVLLFSLMKSKLISYLLPMYPAAALITAEWMDSILETSKERGYRIGSIIIAALSIALYAFGYHFFHAIDGTAKGARIYQDAPRPLFLFGLDVLMIFMLGFVLSALLELFGKRKLSVASMFGALTVFALFSFTEGLNVAQASYNEPLQSLAKMAGAKMLQGYPLAVYIARPVRPSIYFYLPKRIYETNKPPVYGRQGIVTEASELHTMQRFLATNRPSYILTDTRHFPALSKAEPDLTITAQHGRWMLVHAHRIPPSSNSSPKSSENPEMMK